MYVITGADQSPSTLVWLSRDGIHQAILVAVPDEVPVVSPSGSAAPAASAEPTTATPKPTKKP